MIVPFMRTWRMPYLCVCLWSASVGFAYAEEEEALSYRVELLGAQEQEAFLRQYLDIEQSKNSPDLTDQVVRQLYEQSAKQIKDLLATEGYFDAEVTSRIRSAGRKWTVRFEVKLNEPVRIEKVSLIFTGAIASNEVRELAAKEASIRSLEQEWGLAEGQIFKQAKWSEAKNKVLQRLSAVRYPNAKIVSSLAVIDREHHRANLNLQVDSGEAFVFGEAQISGLSRYPEKVVALNNDIKQGDVFDQDKLVALQTRLIESGYFKGVEVKVSEQASATEAAPAVLPVLIVLEEAPSKNLRLGVGFSTNTGLRTQLAYDDKNLLKRGWLWKNNFKLEQLEQSWKSEILLPTRQYGFRDGLSYEIKHEKIAAIGDIYSHAFVLRRNWGTPEIDRTLRLRFLSDSIKSTSIDLPNSNPSALIAGFVWKKRAVDHVLSPSNGYVLQVEADAALRALASSSNFARAYSKAQFFYPLGRSGFSSVRAEFGLNTARDYTEVPPETLFLAGGDQSVRGYAYQSIGHVDEEGNIKHGRILTTVGLELGAWLTQNWGVAGFLDMGAVANKFNDMTFKRGYGVGARWRSPVGPLNLDLAYGQAVRKIQFHINLGFVF